MGTHTGLEDLIERLRAEIVAAYDRGYKAGAAATRELILKAAMAGDDASPERAEPQLSTDGVPARVERGAVRRAVQTAIINRPGQSFPDLMKRVTALDPRITSNASVLNELKRNEGSLYRRDGGCWFAVVSNNAEGPAQSARPSQSNGATGTNGHAASESP